MQARAEAEIKNKYGFHVRPSTAFAQMAQKFSSDIKVGLQGGAEVDAKNIMMLMTLGATCGAQVVINAEGDDAENAVTELKELVDSQFGGIE